jgi:hypothetical protein
MVAIYVADVMIMMFLDISRASNSHAEYFLGVKNKHESQIRGGLNSATACQVVLNMRSHARFERGFVSELK